jgi:DNA-binding GntR family transcriptional regulator
MTEQSREVTPFGGELLSASIKRELMDRIVSGFYSPGERIVESRLAKELGTSQSPIREALRDLAAIGVVTMQSRRGARVRRPTSKELSDVSLVRSEIDALAASLAAPVLREESLAQLEDAVQEMLMYHERGQYVQMTEADAQFHRIIVKASANRAIERVFNQLEPFARTFITLTLPNMDVGTTILQHRNILTALRAQDPDEAAHRARIHQLHVSNLFKDHYPADAVAVND